MFQMDTAQACSAGYDWLRSCWNVVPSSKEDCTISQKHRLQGDCLFVDTKIRGCEGHRGENEIVHSQEDGLYVTLYNAGGLHFSAGSRESVMQAGDILLWDTSLTGSFDCRAGASGRTILFPRRMVERRLGSGNRISGMQSDRHDSRTLLLRSYLEKLHDLAGKTAEYILNDLLEASLELTYLCVIGGDHLPDRARTRAAFQDIRKDIRDHIGSEDLTPAASAARLGMSLRSLQTTLSTHGTTFTALLANERMKRAAQMLRSPASAGVSLSEIALSLGFYDQAHFSNAFRRHYRMSPRQYRNLS
ncbi:MAG: helix-turn-helix domain-containing protein [Novosphingobium sp.]